MTFFRFEHPVFLYALILIPAFIFLFLVILGRKRKVLSRFGDLAVLQRLFLDVSKDRSIIKFSLLMVAYFFLVIGLANPQVGSKLVEAERKGIDIMIALDVSNSMLAEDIKPNRLERAKQAITKLIDELSNDRIGIVIFAGKSYVQLPITTDYGAAKLFLASITTDMMPVQGTAIGSAIELAQQSFNDPNHSRAIIIITDGENHEDDAEKAAAQAAEAGINIYTIGMGLPEGAPIPIMNQFNKQVGYKKDNQGNTVVTRLDETKLQQIASAGNGVYVRASNTQVGLKKVFEEINHLEKTKIESKIFSDYEDRFQYFLAVGLFLLMIELLIFERRSKWADRIKLFGN